ncbi:MAG: DUF3500 domain-containing protein [Pirellulaceae bacterium]
MPTLSRLASAAPTRESAAETAVGRLYDSLTDAQKKMLALPLTDERRNTINANWHITKATVDSFTADQQKIIHEVVKGATSEEGYDRLIKQMADDDGGIHNYSIAIFGNPHEGEFEFELTGRHLTLRADGNTKKAVALGGPIVYGHGESNPDKNLFHYQTKQANVVFDMLEGKQREVALIADPPQEAAVKFRKEGRPMPGIAAGELSSDQKEQFKKSLESVMKIYRAEDVAEVMEVVEAGGGLDKLHFSFYQKGDLKNDKVWDIWRIEGPTVVCHFRGAPHVHAYINVARRA